MKLCSQCEFIYEDDQEHCDMDGAQLVYEPTLEHVFPNNALQARTELERSGPMLKSSAGGRSSRQTAGAGEAVTESTGQRQLFLSCRLLPPTADSLQQPQTSIARRHGRSNRSRLVLQIAAGFVLAVGGFAAFYATPQLFQTRVHTATNKLETQDSKRETTYLTTAVSDASATADKPQIQSVEMKLSQLSDQPETRQSKRETVPASDKLQTASSKREPAVPPLPGLKPMPRLKPLPTLKPIPRLADRSRSVNTSRKAIVVNTSGGTKKDSRFGSFLKRTGRILTKPFKS